MNNHTPEPWDWMTCSFPTSSMTIVEPRAIITSRATHKNIAMLEYGENAEETNANARRIVSCVNACVGVPTKALESAAECAEHGVIPTLAAQYKADSDVLLFAAERAYESMIQERNNVPFKSRPYSTDQTIEILRNAIAKIRGKS